MTKYALIILYLLLASFAHAHPGRLDADGCHNVLKDWKYKDGKVAKAGTYHCHRGFDKMKFDGLEHLLDESPDSKTKTKDDKTSKLKFEGSPLPSKTRTFTMPDIKSEDTQKR